MDELYFKACYQSHLIVEDMMGFILAGAVHSIRIQDRAGAKSVLIRWFASVTTIQTLFVDGRHSEKLIDWNQDMLGWWMTVIKRTGEHHLVLLIKRWVVQITLQG